ncbi:unnamed protein product [Tetraodon nigroviridis]|uniref:(spotted green pufferfish) hypothetical protein n=1 Tax=Tetraodon nigroviridis TaxID=99883 RepID=Q4T5X2_TETNG|nr:unnamed protein product [Tetraodon nigroviridis]
MLRCRRCRKEILDATSLLGERSDEKSSSCLQHLARERGRAPRVDTVIGSPGPVDCRKTQLSELLRSFGRLRLHSPLCVSLRPRRRRSPEQKPCRS